jgi:hypothetical protein
MWPSSFVPEQSIVMVLPGGNNDRTQAAASFSGWNFQNTGHRRYEIGPAANQLAMTSGQSGTSFATHITE